jgi:hypothetical protein
VEIYEYFHQKEREVSEVSLVPEINFWRMVSEQEGSNGKRGTVLGNFLLSERAYLAIYELVQVLNNHATREAYAYYLIIDGEEIWGEERDPSHDPPVHRHTTGHRTLPSEPISLKSAASRAWDDVTARGAL